MEHIQKERFKIFLISYFVSYFLIQNQSFYNLQVNFVYLKTKLQQVWPFLQQHLQQHNRTILFRYNFHLNWRFHFQKSISIGQPTFDNCCMPASIHCKRAYPCSDTPFSFGRRHRSVDIQFSSSRIPARYTHSNTKPDYRAGG